MPRYELVEGKSSKFWEIALTGESFTTTWGRIGTSGQQAVKTFDSAAKAQVEHDKLVAEKVKKGYLLVGSVAAAAPVPKPAAASKTTSPAPAAPVPKPAVASKTTSPAPAAPVSTPVAALSTPAPAPTFGVSRELQARATREVTAIKLAPVAVEPARWFDSVCEGLKVGHARKVLKAGLRESGALVEPIERLLRGALEGFATFDAEVEGLVLTVVPEAHRDTATPDVRAARLVTALVRRWGLVRAVEVFAARAEHGWGVTVEDEFKERLVWLRGHGTPEDILRHRLDRALRAHVLAAPSAEREAAKARAAELRASGSLFVASALNLLFVDPAWVDTDLRARVASAGPWVFNEETLLATPPELSRWLGAIVRDEFELLMEYHHSYERTTLYPIRAQLAVALGAEVPVAFSAWIRSALRLGQDDRLEASWPRLPWTYLSRDLFGILRDAIHPDVAGAAFETVEICTPLKLAKDEDPTPLANEALLRTPHAALPLVRAAAQGKASGWARDLLPRLTRLTQPKESHELAEPDEVPAVLRVAPKKAFKAPGFWVPSAFSALLVNGKALPAHAVDVLGGLLANDAPELAQVKAACSPGSLAAFAWDLFQAWLTAAAPSKEKWAMLALGHFGDDEVARRLTPMVRAWPGEAAHARAVLGLEVLEQIGTDVALMMLNGIAQKLKFKGLQEKAREKMDAIAERRGLTAEELADRLVPDLDLDEDGSKVLDFGPRSFRVGFDETLSPFVMDASGARLKDLPKPNSKDDSELSAAAVETWKATKKDAKALAAIQLLRLELAMGNARRWRGDVFEALLVHHPLLGHVVRRLVWGTYEGQRLVTTFRVAEDKTFATRDDDTFALAPDAVVGVAHRLDLSDEDADVWAQLFRDYELTQPFAQLVREVYPLTPAEREAKALERFEGRVVETKRILGLSSRGWRRGQAQDAGIVSWYSKRVGPEVDAVVYFETGIGVDSLEYSDPTQTLKLVDFGPDEPGWWSTRSQTKKLGELDPIVVSEVIRDIMSLGTVEAA